MNRFIEITKHETPDAAVPALDLIKAKEGFVPNLIKGLAPSPTVVRAYLDLSKAFASSSLTREEREIVMLTASRANECEYCTSLHSVTADSAGLGEEMVAKIRARMPLSNERHEALRTFVEGVVAGGAIPQDMWSEFQAVGYDARNALDVILGVTLKSLTNSVNQFLDTPLDPAFQKNPWSADMSEPVHA